MRTPLWLCLCACAAWAGPLDTLMPGEWYEVPSSHMKDVDPCPASNCSYSAVEGQAGVINDWSGGAFDTQRDRLIVWGGGHGGYAGNEIYAFSLATLGWSRVSEPSDPVNADLPYAPDGHPTSRHTYDYIQYLPAPVDRFCSFGGAGFYQTGQTGTQAVDCYDFAGLAWETSKYPDTQANNLIGSFTAYDSTNGHVWQHGGLQSWLIELDPDAGAWTAHGDQFNDVYTDYYKTAAIDPVGHKLFAVGAGQVLVWDLASAGTITGAEVTTTGATDILTANNPGFEYDAAVQKFVAWKGGADVYTLDPASLVWTKLPPASTNTVTPTAPAGNGTFGRFRYSPNLNVFVVVNSNTEDVFVYRLSAGGGITDTTPPTVPMGLTATAVSSSQIDLTWSASTDDVAVTAYRVFRGGNLVGTASAPSFSDTGLAPSTLYSYTVAALDAAGNVSAPSAPASATTLAANDGGTGGGGGSGGGSATGGGAGGGGGGAGGGAAGGGSAGGGTGGGGAKASGCSCSSAEGWWLLAGLALLPALRRRARYGW